MTKHEAGSSGQTERTEQQHPGQTRRAKSLGLGRGAGGSGGGGGGTGVAVVTAEELSHIVSSAVSEALDSRSESLGHPRLFDRHELALALDCSPGLVDKLRRQGMPCLYLGDSPRFEIEPCVQWLREKKATP